MSLFDILQNADFGSALNSIAKQARGMAGNIQNATPGGMGGLLGAGALGAVLGNLMSSDVVKGVAVAGAGAMAWNFYKKWAAAQKGQDSSGMDATTDAQPEGFPSFAPSRAAPVDPTAELVIRAMTYAAKADGNIDAAERERMNLVLKNLLPGQNVEEVIETISREPLDPQKIASGIRSREQADDVYRISCAAIDVDHFMETSYLDALAKALGINAEQKKQIEAEADMARRQLHAAIPA